ncbi:MAG: hypothetical protein ROO76_23030 [Terriglobia bacterium]|nr:hypothetical protein [Terriglobia bacterium]
MLYSPLQQRLPFAPSGGRSRQSSTILRLKAFSGDEWNTISLADRTCDCAEFSDGRGNCQHLGAVGLYRVRAFRPSSHPTFSQALSALVKSLRLRRNEDAVYWLVYLDKFTEREFRFRTARRLLIGSAEDGHSIAVMEAVSDNFRVLCRRGETSVADLATEAVRICKVPCWWDPSTGGPDYIYSGMIGQRELAYSALPRTPENMIKLIERGLEEKKKTTALAGVMGLSDARMGSTKQAEAILGLAKKYRHPLAEALAHIHLRSKSALSGDNNFLCQAAWLMAGGVTPVADAIEPVTANEVAQMLDDANERWKNPEPIPRWCVDGFHSAGDDVRFAGMWHHMYAVCKAFEFYGRVDPNDEWRPEFWCRDGLVIETVATEEKSR